jgi:hypothetical protein
MADATIETKETAVLAASTEKLASEETVAHICSTPGCGKPAKMACPVSK